jgi:hypothetical protein
MSFPLKYIQEAIIDSQKEIDTLNEINKIDAIIDKSIELCDKNYIENNLIVISNLKTIKLSLEMIKNSLENDFKK